MNYKNPKCFARELGNCSKDIQREHFISKAVLRNLTEDGINVGVAGLGWQADESVSNFGINSLQAKILCNTHHRPLSKLDQVAGKLFEFLTKSNHDFLSTQPEKAPNSERFTGLAVERWLLKLLIGMAVSGNAVTSSGNRAAWTPPTNWLEILFNDSPFPEGWGVYLPSNFGSFCDPSGSGFSFGFLHNSIAGVYGSVTDLVRIRMILVMVRPPKDLTNTLLDGFAHRTSTIRMSNGSREKTLNLDWPNNPERMTNIEIGIGSR